MGAVIFAAIRDVVQLKDEVDETPGHGIWHFTRNYESVVTVRIGPAVAVDKTRALESLGWEVHVTDSAGHQFDPLDFDRLSSLSGERPCPHGRA
jgi:hypothetical protein